jgi:hypothetical protein
VKVLAHEERIRRCGGEVAVVVHDRPGRLAEGLLAGLDVPFPVLVDTERRAYDAWGLTRSAWWGIYLDPRLWGRYARLLLTGVERWRPRGTDPLQLGGDVVVAPGGTIVYARPQERDDRPPVGELVRVVEEHAAR